MERLPEVLCCSRPQGPLWPRLRKGHRFHFTHQPSPLGLVTRTNYLSFCLGWGGRPENTALVVPTRCLTKGYSSGPRGACPWPGHYPFVLVHMPKNPLGSPSGTSKVSTVPTHLLYQACLLPMLSKRAAPAPTRKLYSVHKASLGEGVSRSN